MLYEEYLNLIYLSLNRITCVSVGDCWLPYADVRRHWREKLPKRQGKDELQVATTRNVSRVRRL